MSLPAEQIAEVLSQGGVVLLPTDTVLGLAASPAHPQAVDRLYELKARPRDKNLPIMVAGVEQIASLGAVIPGPAVKLLNSRYVPGALTLVLTLDAMRAPGWLKDRSEIAIRIPDNDLLLDVLRHAGPLMVTSANRSGTATPASTDKALMQLDGAPDLTVPGKGAAPAPSTIVNCTVEPVRIERHGVITDAEIQEVLT